MRSLPDLLEALSDSEVELWVRDEEIHYRAPKGHLRVELLEEIRAHRPALVALLGSDAPCPIRAAPRLVRRDIEKDVPLTLMQTSFVESYGQLGQPYLLHVLCRIPLSGDIDPEIVRETVREILRRHSVLRSRFTRNASGTLVAQLDGPPEFEWMTFDAEAAGGHLEPAAAGPLALLWKPGFDLESGPLVRVGLIVSGSGTKMLIWVAHHAVLDGWSTMILYKEFHDIYACIRAGHAPPPRLGLQFGDFAFYQREWLGSAEGHKARRYWKAELAGVPAVPVPRREEEVGDSVGPLSGVFSTELIEKLRRAASRHGTSLSVIAMSAFVVVVHQWTGAWDLLTWVCHLGRGDVRLVDVVGCMLDLWLLRVRFASVSSFAELAQMVHGSYIGALRTCGFPIFEMLELPPPGSPPPLLCNFNYQSSNGTPNASRGVGGGVSDVREQVPHESATSEWVTRGLPDSTTLDPGLMITLQLDCFEQTDAFHWAFKYAAEKLARPTVQAFAQTFCRILETVARDSELPIAQLPTLSKISARA